MNQLQVKVGNVPVLSVRAKSTAVKVALIIGVVIGIIVTYYYVIVKPSLAKD